MKLSIIKGLSFGITSCVTTTLGMIVGIDATTNSRLAVIAGIIAIAIADAFSDAIGIHVSEEAEDEHSKRHLWESTLATFFAKFVFAMLFIIPVLLLELKTAVIADIVFGLLLITTFNLFLARRLRIRPYKIVMEHVGIAIAVIAITYVVGKWVGTVI